MQDRFIRFYMSPTCRLHTNTGHVVSAISSLPFSIFIIHIDTRLLHFWFKSIPVGKGHFPAVNRSEISSLKEKDEDDI